MVVMDLEGNRVEGKYKPSSDTPTHLELYKRYEEIGGIVHTHSPRRLHPGLRQEEAFHFMEQHMRIIFYGEIPCARSLTPEGNR